MSYEPNNKLATPKNTNIIPIFTLLSYKSCLFFAPYLNGHFLLPLLLFFAIPEELSIGPEFQGVLLFVILISCLIMTWSMISNKNKLAKIGEYEEDDLLEEEESEISL